ncbi:unnamed protein product [Rotaria sordida]|uniref:Transposase n=1 Tax=Rotaria sordida TaxID=392033 RepID=A0A815M941_9BILA|nr:unnamed protein product [Rotaria sordida]
MPKPSKRSLHSRNIQLAMKRLLDKDLQHETESSSESDEEEMKINEDSSDTLMKFKDKVTLHEISDIFELCKNKCNSKFISVLIYMTLRYFDITWRDCDIFLKEIGALSSRTCHKWVEIFISEDLDSFCGDNRGGKRTTEFYDVYPEIELAAKSYSIERCANKSADFTALDLAIFIDQNYYELTNTTKDKNTNLIRSVPSCRLDLRRWGARFDSNSKRSYFEGHERVDVVCERENFVKYFLDHKDQYYTVSDDENPLWKTPTQNPPSILILDNARTHTARSYSLLDFGKSIGTRCPTDTIEYVDQQGVTQVIDCYFKTGPNKGLSKGLIEISKELNIKLPPKLKLEQLRDILSSHPAFNISIGTRCPTDTIEYVDQQGVTQVIDRYFKTGPNKGLSKGLIEISKELNIKLPPKLKLEQLRDVLSSHPTFNIISDRYQLSYQNQSSKSIVASFH